MFSIIDSIAYRFFRWWLLGHSFKYFAGSLLNTVVLWVKSKWKPILYINWHMIYRVIGKSIWNTIEQICVWIPVCFDTFLISKFLSVNDLGLYTTSKTLFNMQSDCYLLLYYLCYSVLSHVTRIVESC